MLKKNAKTSCVQGKCLYRWRETNIFQVYYIVLAMDLILSFPPRPRRKYCLMIWPKICLLFLSQYKTVWISRLGSELMVRRIDLKFTFYSTIYLCSRCIARYKLANMHARTTIWGAWNVRCTIVHTNMF